MRSAFIGATTAIVTCLSGCAHMPPDEPSDPLEPINRGVFAFNRTADKYVLRPVAKSYRSYLPTEFQQGIHNFIDNLFYPTTIVNGLLQGKFEQAAWDTARFTINTTVGIVGIMDIATPMGLPRNDEDLGQTIGKWGSGAGWYLMLPVLGPSSGRDLIGDIGDAFTSPLAYGDTPTSVSISAIDAVDGRSRLLDADRLLDEQLDPYLFIRTTYFQNRDNLVFDGNPPKPKFEFFDE